VKATFLEVQEKEELTSTTGEFKNPLSKMDRPPGIESVMTGLNSTSVGFQCM
jgi:hypothetical protein